MASQADHFDENPGFETAADPAADSQTWRLGLAWARLALAVAYLADHWINLQWAGWTAKPLVFGFVAYALAALLWSYRSRASLALLGLCIDTIFFLSFAHHETDHSPWLNALLYLFVMIAALSLHGWRETCLLAAVSAAFFAVSPSLRSGRLFETILIAGALACAFSLRKSRAEGLLARRSSEAEELRLRLGTAVSEERQRIAGDFHDGPLQNFISMQMRLEVLRKLLERDAPTGLKELVDLQETAKTQVRELRAFLRALRPAQVAGDGLATALQQAVADFQKDSGINVSFQIDGLAGQQLTGRAADLVQIVREALHNVQKHSGASRVAFRASKAANSFEITIDDNGVGFSFSGVFRLEEMETLGIGPGSIKRRVRGLGGDLSLESRPGRGAALRIRIPA